MLAPRRWPDSLWIVRHGQSAGNVARDAADEASLDRIAISGRDVDVPLSALGEKQALALGKWFGCSPAPPEVILASPYRRAIQTAEIVRAAGTSAPRAPVTLDERLREKEFGLLDGYTLAGVQNRFPEQAEARKVLGKFYHRPPGGESWCDVILRVRSLLDTVSLHYAQRRVLIVAHQVVVLCVRYVLEGFDEQQILAIDAKADVANCSVTHYCFEGDAYAGSLRLQRYNYEVPAEGGGVVTREPDLIRGRRG